MEEARLEILAEICRRFNQNEVKYVVCGAFASKLHGVEEAAKQLRPTRDYDYIIEGSRENVKRIKNALKNLFTEIEELKGDDFEKYTTIQVIEEKDNLALDLIVRMWGVDYDKAIEDAVMIEFIGVKAPIISINNLLEMKKDSFRPQDRFDTYWLIRIKEQK